MDKVTIEEVKQNEELEEIFLEQNLRLVWEVIHRHFEVETVALNKDDYFQLGCIGLLKSIRKFDLNRGFAFSTYAYPMIWGEISRSKRDLAMSSTNTTRSMKEKFLKIKTLQNKFKTPEEIINELNITMDEYGFIMNAFCFYYSLDTPIEDETGHVSSSMEKYVSCTGFEDELVDKYYYKNIIELLKRNLNKNQYDIFILRYIDGCTQMEISCKTNISQAHVSRILAYISKKLIPNLKLILDGEITQEEMENQNKLELRGRLYAEI